MQVNTMCLRKDANRIIKGSIQKVLPDEAVTRALKGKNFDEGKLYVVAAGKAAWQMAKAASDVLGEAIEAGVVCTKYDHVMSDLPRFQCMEGGHPVPDANSYRATQIALDMTQNLSAKDTVIFLLSGGGSALFEKPLLLEHEMAEITEQLLACGANIVEMNTIRKRLSAVKGGRFARHCQPAHVYSIVLSDILGDPLDMIASGPAYPDSSTCQDAMKIADKYNLLMSEAGRRLLSEETPKTLNNVETVITGSVRELCRAAADICRQLGYTPFVLTDQLSCQAKEAGSFLASIARTHQNTKKSLAFIAGGETIVHLTGCGKGGRNQEVALSAAEGIAGLRNTAIFSIGSDGTDGPTDAAGGFVDGTSREVLKAKGFDIYQSLHDNNAYPALKASDGLIFTGATGTNVNDVSVVLIRRNTNIRG